EASVARQRAVVEIDGPSLRQGQHRGGNYGKIGDREQVVKRHAETLRQVGPRHEHWEPPISRPLRDWIGRGNHAQDLVAPVCECLPAVDEERPCAHEIAAHLRCFSHAQSGQGHVVTRRFHARAYLEVSVDRELRGSAKTSKAPCFSRFSKVLAEPLSYVP